MPNILTPMGNRRQLIQHNGKTIILHDYTGLSGQAYIDAVEYNGRAGELLQLHDRMILMDVTDSIVDKEIMKVFKRVSKKASPNLSKTAVVGATGIQKMFLQTVAAFANLEVKTFDNRNDAVIWLSK